jgi:hypothetical protein
MNMPKPERKIKLLSQKKKSLNKSAKVYLRNFGKGQLEYSDNALSLYTKKGVFSDRKKIAKSILLVDVENVSLEKNELAVTYKGVTERFVFEDVTLAQQFLEKTNDFVKLREKTLEEQVVVSQVKAELAGNISYELPVVDSLFDVLRSLHGRIDWNRIMSYLERSEKDHKAIVDGKNNFVNLDFSSLSSAINEHDVGLISKEGLRLLEAIYNSLENAATANEASVQFEGSNLTPEAALKSYYVLNDLILASTVGDEDVGPEISYLTVLLGYFSKETGTSTNSDEILNLVNKLVAEHANELLIEEVRKTFKKQLKVAASK